jgi:type IV secretory pathway VirB9-like protein
MARLRLSLYANDVIVFVKPIKADFDLTMTILQRFDDATGLRINLQKSAVAPISFQ